MKRAVCILILTGIITGKIVAQDDKQAFQILDRFSSRATSAPSVGMKFTLVTDDQVENQKESVEGNVVIKGDKYFLKLPDNIIWYDGESSWSYLPAEKEVTITRPDKKDNSFQSKPSSLFSMYKKGYKARLIDENSGNYVIDLYPEDYANELIRARLTIEKTTYALKSLEYKRRDGITLTLMVQSYDLSKVTDPSFFTFNATDYKGTEIIDIR